MSAYGRCGRLIPAFRQLNHQASHMTHKVNRKLLDDGTIALRALEPADLDDMTRWENDTRVWSAGSQGAPLSRHQIAEYIANYDADIFSARQLRLIVTETASGTAVGAVDLYDFDPLSRRAGVGIIIDEAARGRGYAARALTLLWEYASLHLDMHQLWAMTAMDNTRRPPARLPAPDLRQPAACGAGSAAAGNGSTR